MSLFFYCPQFFLFPSKLRTFLKFKGNGAKKMKIDTIKTLKYLSFQPSITEKQKIALLRAIYAIEEKEKEEKQKVLERQKELEKEENPRFSSFSKENSNYCL